MTTEQNGQGPGSMLLSTMKGHNVGNRWHAIYYGDVQSNKFYFFKWFKFLGDNSELYFVDREIAFVRELHKTAPVIDAYYMGFYIHSCSKMRYKGQYTPSFLVCPETYSWIPIEKCRPLLDTNAYSRLEKEGVGMYTNKPYFYKFQEIIHFEF